MLKEKLVHVSKGKYYKERYVPMTESIREDLENYIHVARAKIQSFKPQKQEALFLSMRAKRMHGNSMILRLQKLAEIANINKEIGLHTLCHSIATHLLKSGMELEEVSRFLGHSGLESTQIMRYRFDKSIETKLKSFGNYLQELGNGENTIRQKSNYVGYFLSWLQSENLQPQETTYNDMLSFIDYCNLEGNSKRQINSKLRSIRNFYEYLKNENPSIINPAANLVLKGVRQKLPSNIIDYAVAEKLYNAYETSDNRSKRNKVILGLLVYQGLTTEELHELQPEHLKLKQGKIHVPGNSKKKRQNT